MEEEVDSPSPLVQISTEISSNIQVNDTNRNESHFSGITKAGAECLLKNFVRQTRLTLQGKTCAATWDGINCWPATSAGKRVRIQCLKFMRKNFLINGEPLTGYAFRSCSKEGTWVAGYSNYSDCLQQIKASLSQISSQSTSTVGMYIPYVLLIGSIISVAFLAIAICIYLYVKSLYLDRLKILLQMMIALLFKSVLWILMALPTVFPKSFHFTSQGWTCNVILSLHFYTLLVTTFWMSVLGHYLNRRLIKSWAWINFSKFRYHALCWGIPVLIVCVWATLMTFKYETSCWRNYTSSSIFWIIVIPLLTALLINCLYLYNVLKSVRNRAPTAQTPNQIKQIGRAKRDIFFLCPVLGIHNLLFFYNPGENFKEYYMLYHAIFQSIQGSIVAILCCFISADVHKAFWRKLKRCYCNRPKEQFKFEDRLIRPRFRAKNGSGKRVHFLEQRDCIYNVQLAAN